MQVVFQEKIIIIKIKIRNEEKLTKNLVDSSGVQEGLINSDLRLRNSTYKETEIDSTNQ